MSERTPTTPTSSLRADADHGPGCPRHEGDPHNLCMACWELEPDPMPSCAVHGAPWICQHVPGESLFSALRLRGSSWTN